MLAITGDTFEVRERLKGLGCRWDEGAECWVAPDESARAEGQALADAEPWRKWRDFCAGLAWAPGSFTTTVFEAGLNGCSRGIPRAAAIEELRGRCVAAGRVPQAGWMDRNVGRAYERAEPPKVKAGRGIARAGGKGGMGGNGSEEGEAVRPPEKPKFEEPKLAALAGDWARVADAVWLADRSPVAPATAGPADFLGALYRPGERVVIFADYMSQGQWVWSHEGGFDPSLVDFRAWDGADPQHLRPPALRAGAPFAPSGPQGVWYLCNPVDGAFRETAERDKWERPKWSRRWEQCVTAWRYFVFESDTADPRSWVGAMVQLPLAIAAIYTSGGKSVHVLVRVNAQSKPEFDLWRETAKRVMIPLGADPGCMSAVRLTRLPGCVRRCAKDGTEYPRPRRQRLLFLDPAPEPVPLVERAALRDTLGDWERLVGSLTARPHDPEDSEPVDVPRLVVRLRGLKCARGNELAERLGRWGG